jgi:hypothetical protein
VGIRLCEPATEAAIEDHIAGLNAGGQIKRRIIDPHSLTANPAILSFAILLIAPRSMLAPPHFTILAPSITSPFSLLLKTYQLK